MRVSRIRRVQACLGAGEEGAHEEALSLNAIQILHLGIGTANGENLGVL